MTESAALTRFLTASAAVQRQEWDAALACLAADCEWTLLPTGVRMRGTEAIRKFMQSGMAAGDRAPPEIKSAFGTDTEGVFEYVSRGVATARAAVFGEAVKAPRADASSISNLAEGDRYEVHVCFLFRTDAAGLISEVREYFAMPPRSA